MNIVTHSGRFHTDEVYATALLTFLFNIEDENITRTRDPIVINNAEEDDNTIIIDVGRKYNPDKCVSSFMGFFPSNNPQFALCIHVDEPKRMKVDESSNLHHGGNCAAIIFKRIARQTMDIYNQNHQTVSENKQYVNDFKIKNQDLLNEMRSW